MSEEIRCRGRIQGRGLGGAYRWETLREARRLGVQGWVRNRSDGSVEGVLEGERSAVEALIAWCRRGPALARVTGVQVDPEPFGGEFAGFDIRR